MKSTKKKIILGAAVVFGVIVLPLAYSLFYLGAFWDPYSTLQDLPIAVVNEDSGAVINGESRNLGNELADRLKDNSELKWEFTNADDATSGVEGTEYYAKIVIPADFSSNIASAATTDKVKATITYTSNEKKNFLATQIMNRAVVQLEEEIRSNVNEEITSQLSSKLKEVPSQLQDLSDGLGTMYDGTVTIKDKVGTASSGTDTLMGGLSSLNTGLGTLKDGSATMSSKLQDLQSGIAQLDSGAQLMLKSVQASQSDLSKVGQLSSGAKQVSDGVAQAAQGTQKIYDAASSTTAGLPALQTGISAVDQGANSVSSGLTSYTAGVNSLITQNQTLAKQLATIYSSTQMTDAQKVAALGTVVSSISSSDLQTQLTKLTTAGTTLSTGASQVAAGADSLKNAGSSLATLQSSLGTLNTSMKQLSDGASQVSAGTNELSSKLGSFSTLEAGLSQLANGLKQADTGSQQLYSGSVTLASGIATAQTGSSKLATGGSQLVDGVNELSDGVKTAKDEVDSKITTANSDVKALDGLDTYASDPVDVNQTPVNEVPNYGTAFAPYFMSLSLYVGGLIMFVGIYLDSDEKIKVLSRNSNNKFVRVGVFAAIGVAQALLLALLVKYGLGLTVVNVPVYYLSCILVSMVFISIIEFFFVNLKDAGKFLAMLLLILQLTSCGGTFPMELVPKFFQVLYPYMPMTYSVQIFKEAISGYDSGIANRAMLILVIIFVFFTGLTMLFSIGRKAKEKFIEKNETGTLSA
jgi:putative membrane protein